MEIENDEFSVTVNSENNLNVFRHGDEVLIFFILETDGGRFQVCWGLGNNNKIPVGQSSGELALVASRSEAEAVIQYLNDFANIFLDRDEGDYIVRGAFDRS